MTSICGKHHWVCFAAAVSITWAAGSQVVDAALAPNALLGSCLTEDWANSVATKLKVDRSNRDALGRLVHPFLRSALDHPLYSIDDPRTANPHAYDPSCMVAGAILYGVGAKVDNKTGDVVDVGYINGSLIVELSGWTSHSLTTLVFSILAAEALGYSVSHYYITDTLTLTERMSSVNSGVCTPTHANLEVWIAGIEAALAVYANESSPIGATGYFGRSGLYTTSDFVESSVDATKHPVPLFADYWKGYKYFEELIKAVPVSALRNNQDFFPPKEVGCADGSFGCLNSCSRSLACTQREANGGECMVVAMMYDYFDPGYLQAVMSNLDIPAYFCFLGYEGVQDYALYAQKTSSPVLFYHYEPDPFHVKNAGLFQRVFLPRSVPERVVLATGRFGENGFGKKTDNPIDVDFPSTRLAKYVASQLQGTPAEHLLSKFTLQDLDINDLLRKQSLASQDAAEPDPTFRAACQWVRDNYDSWSLWLDRLPICTFDTHIRYSVAGCNDSHRVITFEWTQADPDDPSQAYNCDGGLAELPAPLLTSRSCEWIKSDSTKWRDWVRAKPECDASFYKYNVTECDSGAKRTVKYWWLLPDPKDCNKSLECTGGASLPTEVSIDCEYMPTSSPTFLAVLSVSIVGIVVLLMAIGFVVVERKKPIVKRSQYEMLILMLLGGILVCVAAVLYAGKPTKALCVGRPATISLGFTTIFGSLFVKSLRVYRVFFKSSMKRVAITLRMMLKVFLVFFMVDVLILAVWFIVDFPRPTVTIVAAREFRGDVDYITCKSSSFLFTAVLMFWKAIVLFSGLYLSFLIRNVSSDFQESIWIFASSLIVLIACLVILPLAYVVEMAAAVFYVFLACALLLSTAVVMGMMLLPKLWRLNEQSRSSAYTNDTSSETPNKLTHSKGSAMMLIRNGSGGVMRGPVSQRPHQRLTSSNATVVHPVQGTNVGEESDATHM